MSAVAPWVSSTTRSWSSIVVVPASRRSQGTKTASEPGWLIRLVFAWTRNAPAGRPSFRIETDVGDEKTTSPWVPDRVAVRRAAEVDRGLGRRTRPRIGDGPKSAVRVLVARVDNTVASRDRPPGDPGSGEDDRDERNSGETCSARGEHAYLLGLMTAELDKRPRTSRRDAQAPSIPSLTWNETPRVVRDNLIGSWGRAGASARPRLSSTSRCCPRGPSSRRP